MKSETTTGDGGIVGGQEVASSGAAVPATHKRFRKNFKGKGGNLSLGARGRDNGVQSISMHGNHPLLSRSKRKRK